MAEQIKKQKPAMYELIMLLGAYKHLHEMNIEVPEERVHALVKAIHAKTDEMYDLPQPEPIVHSATMIAKALATGNWPQT